MNLAFPAGLAPGFDPAHVAGAVPLLSAVAKGTGAINLLSGKQGTAGVLVAATAVIHGTIGPSAGTVAATGNGVQFSGISTVNFSNVTLAVIAVPTAIGGATMYCAAAGGTNSGFALGWSSTGLLRLASQSVNTYVSNITLTAGVPYFLAASTQGTQCVFVAVNLLTGQIFTNTVVTTIASSAPNGAASMGWATSGGSSANTAAMMYSGQYNPLQALLIWAADPWSFWYPNK
jgi:hypothetical protein